MTDFKKVDDALAAPDKTASALLPLLVRRNLLALCEARAPQCMHVWQPEDIGGNVGQIELSTHPDQWWGWPFLIPRIRGITGVSVDLTYKVTADMGCRLYVDGSRGSEVTLSSTSKATTTISATVDDSPDQPAYAVAILAFQSTRDGSAVATTVSGANPGRDRLRSAALAVATGSIGTSGRVHNCIGDDGDPRVVYVGYNGSTDGDCRVWPRAGISTGNVYDLSYLEPYGVSIRLTGDEDDIGSLEVPPIDGTAINEVMVTDPFEYLSDAAWKLYGQRGHWCIAGPEPVVTADLGAATGRQGRHGVVPDDGVKPFGCAIERRVDSEGVRVIVGGLANPTEDEVSVTIRIRDIDASVDESTTITAGAVDPGARATSASLAQFIRDYNSGDYTTMWGASDAISANEAATLTVIDAVIPWPDGTSVGDRLLVSGTTALPGWDIVLAATVTEAYPDQRPDL